MNTNTKYKKSRKAMIEAFLELLSHKEIECVSVKEICEKAGVNRSTFYLHYDNIYDLICDVLDYIKDLFRLFFKPRTNNVFRELPLKELVFIDNSYLIPYLEFTKQYRVIFLAMTKNPAALKLDDMIKQMNDITLEVVFERFRIPEKNKKYMFRYHLYGIGSIIEAWIKDDCTDSVDEIAMIIKDCVLGRNNPISFDEENLYFRDNIR